MKTIYKKLLFLMLLLPFSALAQGTLDGTVVDAKSKQPLPGVNVVIQGTSTGAQTDFDGKFKLNNVKKGDKVVFSYIGYKNAVVSYDSQKEITVSLEEEANQLQEVVVQVGYGAVKKRDATGAVELITTKDFNKGAITSVEGLLNGRAGGVVITSSGTPGDSPVIRIRGGSSLLASNDPLVVVDGLPIDGGLASVNPNDIESFSILKDASSAAIYGNRASGGVILITTKKGSKKDIQVNLNTFTTLNTLAKKQEVYNAEHFRALIKSKVPAEVGQLGTASTDWQDEIFKDSYTSDVSASVLGNIFGKVPARLSVGNTSNNGILMTSEFKRSTGSFALNPSLLDDHLKLNINGNYAYTFVRKADEGAIGSAISFDPTQSVYDPTSPFGGYTESYDENANGTIVPRGPSNPVSQLLEKRDTRNVERYYGNFNLDYKLHFFPDLRVILNYGIDRTRGNGLNRTNPLSRSGFNTNTQALNNNFEEGQVGNYSRSQDDNFDRKNENRNVQLNYTKTLGKLSIDLLAGYDWQQFDEEKYGTGNENLYSNDEFGEAERGNIDTYTSPGNNLQAYFGRLNLGFASKYLLTVNFRRDGSTKVSPINKWQNFWGAAFAWKIKEESFLKNSNVFSDLKLRLSYGETGQQNLPNPYAWFKRYTISGNAYYQFGNQFFLVARPEGYNENLMWETSKKSNIGLDFAFFNNRLRGSIDAYTSKTENLFATTVQGALVNFYIQGPTNIGSLESKGMEFALSADVIKKENFELSFNYNLSFNKLEITNLFSDDIPQGGVGDNQNVQIHKVGLSPFSFWVYEQVYDANGRPIENTYVDRDGNGIINSDDKYNFHKPQPDAIMGLMVNATFYKNWDFSMAWRANINNYIYDKVSADRSVLSGLYNSFSDTVQNTTTDYSNTYFTANNKLSDYYVKNGTFVKLDNITLGYNFRETLRNDKVNLRLYAGIQNVLIITKYKGVDPEVFNNGIDGTIFPRARMFMLGVNANF